MMRKKKLYTRPRKPFEAVRIKEENKLLAKYGLKNKTEIWKTLAKVNYYRHRAKALAKKPLEEQEVLFNKLRALGLKIEGTADVLGLKIENLLERRLSTVVVHKKLANTPKQARQLIVHKNILIEDKVINSPSYLVSILEEEKIKIKKGNKKPKEHPQTEASKEETSSDSEHEKTTKEEKTE
ncbi:30S ribosomal protein S4 [Candidatus Pacearchaeota archaeon]|nr:30S ribosomal protein S4 [Candidatus Pacearchaeota archaeon]